uniref:protein Hook homolog 3-like isoform X4 n=1 Tax=Styela clava TaxID=7725 RepID=UPI0019393481|nr:protein Hook homolog 3-like isoform X4 [Styela clava]
MDEHEILCDSLMTWLSNFDVPAPHQYPHEVTDGVAIAQILGQIDGEFFDTTWLSRIKEDVGDNFRLKTNNLKKVLNHMIDYFREVTGNELVGFQLPDLMAISEQTDKQQLGRLLQLILGVVVNCSKKQHYIEEIMQLDEDVQHVVMTAIQELMQHYVPCGSENNDTANSDMSQELQSLRQRMTELIAEKEEMAQRCHELDNQLTTISIEHTTLQSDHAMLFDQVALLHEEKSNIQLENEQLQERLSAEHFDDPTSPASVRHTQMLQQIEILQEETYRLESARDDFKLRCEVLERELTESQTRVDDLSTLADESRMLKDEIDYLRSASIKATKLEATVETYKTKLKELGDLRGQVKLLEDKNTSFMEQTVQLEEELRKANAARVQLDTYKRQVLDLHNKLSEETRRADKAEFEVKTRSEKIKNLEAEKERLSIERDSLQETNDELQMTSHQQGSKSMTQETLLGSGDSGSDGFSMNPLEMKEKLIRLQHENKMLQARQVELGDERTAELTSKLEVANARINELETETRLSNQRSLELQNQVKDLQSDLQDKGSQLEDPHNAALRKKLEEHLVKLRDRDSELQNKKAYIEEIEPQVSAGDRQVNELKELLKKKEDDMRNMEERYKKYLEKAKTVIRTLDPNKNQQQSGTQMEKLKAQLNEKDKLLKQAEQEREKTKQTRDQEERMIVNAWYNMGMKLHRKAVDERLSHTNPGQSFLARQRQASAARRSHPGSAARRYQTSIFDAKNIQSLI